MRFRLGMIPVLAFLASCATAPLADPALDKAGKTFAAAPAECSIYVHRNSAVGAAVGLDIWLDGRLAGQVDAFTYYLWRVTPGQHQLLARAENTAMLPIDCAAGEIVYVEQSAQIGWMQPRTALRRVNAAEAQPAILNCTRAQSLLFAGRTPQPAAAR